VEVVRDAEGWVYSEVDHDSELAKRAALLGAAVNDLTDVLGALDRLRQCDANDALGRAAWWSFAVMRYARLFATGRRRHSVARPLKATLQSLPRLKEVHEAMLGIRNKHIAHVDGGLDEEGVVIEVRIRNGNELQRRARPYSAIGIAPRGDFLDAVEALVQQLRAQADKEYVEQVEPALIAEVGAIPAADLAAAPRSEAMRRTATTIGAWKEPKARW
jgi:hypothetical protein